LLCAGPTENRESLTAFARRSVGPFLAGRSVSTGPLRPHHRKRLPGERGISLETIQEDWPGTISGTALSRPVPTQGRKPERQAEDSGLTKPLCRGGKANGPRPVINLPPPRESAPP